MSRNLLQIALLAGLLAVGCENGIRSAATSGPEPVGRVDHITVFGTLAAVNMDDEPAPDGVGVQIFYNQRGRAETVPVTGTTDVLLFDGQIRASQIDQAEPLRKWSFPGEQMRQWLIRKMGQWGYGLTLRWGEQVPEAESVTIVVRYRPPEGAPVYSRPLAIMVGR